MSYPLSIESPDEVCFLTTRTVSSRLWFVNNPKLHERFCAYLAKYAEMYGVLLYGFIIIGNHYHLMARFPESNKAAFLKAFNSITALLCITLVEEHEGGPVWGRRARSQVLPESTDVENWFFY